MSLALEILGAIFGCGYLFLIAKKRIIAWALGITSCILLSIVSFKNELNFQGFVQIINVLLGLLGWYQWKRSVQNVRQLSAEKKSRLYIVLFVCSLLSGAICFYLSKPALAIQHSIDGVVLLLSFVATLLTVFHYAENWVLWILVNLLTAILTFGAGLYAFGILSLVYFLFSIYGLKQWQKMQDENI